MLDVDAATWEQWLARGWRRFGVAYFRPKCGDCSECVPLRVPVDQFSMSRNQRRVWKNSERFRLTIHPPRIDPERLTLYRAWHGMQGTLRSWDADDMTAERYFHEFAFPHPSVLEFAYYDDQASESSRLVAVAIVDETPNALSAVYTYHHPDYRKLSVGTASVLRQVSVAGALRKKWLYLGYRVMGCISSEYKARFRPHEALEGWPEVDESPVWSGERSSR